jgi:hypothetical protein
MRDAVADFEHHAEQARAIELEIERKGIALGIDWKDAAEVRALAHEALDHYAENVHRAARDPHDRRQMAKVELFGLAALMLRTMEESATGGFEVHGGDAWKAFARALWAEKLAREGRTPGEGAR